MVKHPVKSGHWSVIYDEAVYLQGHLSVLVEDGDVKHQPSQEVLQHGGPEVPGHTGKWVKNISVIPGSSWSHGSRGLRGVREGGRG